MVTSKAVLAIVCTVLNAARRPRERPDNGPYEFLLARHPAPPGMRTNHPARPRSVAAIDVNKLKENIVIRCYFHEAQRARLAERCCGSDAPRISPRKIILVIACALYMEAHPAPPCFDFIRPRGITYLMIISTK